LRCCASSILSNRDSAMSQVFEIVVVRDVDGAMLQICDGSLFKRHAIAVFHNHEVLKRQHLDIAVL
jgi:hypothetical protein